MSTEFEWKGWSSNSPGYFTINPDGSLTIVVDDDYYSGTMSKETVLKFLKEYCDIREVKIAPYLGIVSEKED